MFTGDLDFASGDAARVRDGSFFAEFRFQGDNRVTLYTDDPIALADLLVAAAEQLVATHMQDVIGVDGE